MMEENYDVPWDAGYLCSGCRWMNEYGCNKYKSLPGEFVRRKKKCKYFEKGIFCDYFAGWEQEYPHTLLMCVECIMNSYLNLSYCNAHNIRGFKARTDSIWMRLNHYLKKRKWILKF